MTDRPKRNAVANREATDKLLDNRKRRSSAQVQQEKQTAATAAAASEEKKINLASQKKHRVAAFEDQLRREDQQRMARPDLVAAHHPVTSYLQSSFKLSLSPYFYAGCTGKTYPEAMGPPSEGIHKCHGKVLWLLKSNSCLKTFSDGRGCFETRTNRQPEP
jgi:hypothetical protein